VLAQLVEDLVHLEGATTVSITRSRGSCRARWPSSRCAATKMSFHRRASRCDFIWAGRSTGPYPRAMSSLALWKKYRAKSKIAPQTGLPSTVTCFSSRCQPRGRTSARPTGLQLVALGSLLETDRAGTASRRLSCRRACCATSGSSRLEIRHEVEAPELSA